MAAKTAQPEVDWSTAQPMASGDVDWSTAQPIHGAPPASEQPQPMMTQMAQGAKNLGIGAAKGLLHTVSGADDWARQHLPAFMTNSDFGFGPPANLEHVHQMATPQGTAQKIGYGGEQAGEFLIPGGAEEGLAEKAAEFAPKLKPLARIAAGALSAGAVNKAQGGSFKGGMAAGAAGGAVGEGLKAVAPGIAESALKIRKLDRAYGKTPGEAVLNETRGVRPGTVAESARSRLNEINPELEKIVGAPGNSAVDLRSPRDVIQSAQNKAISRNAASGHAQLQPMAKHLSENFVTGAPIPQMISPIDALNLKRGFGDEFIHNWNPETMSGTRGTAARTYHSLADEIHTAAPGSKELDERAASLIPVAKRAASTELNADTGQRVLGRVAAHTGAATLGGLGAVQGYRENGAKGAILGGVGGIAIPELVASPTAQMAVARTLYSPASKILPKLLVGGSLQHNR